MTQFFETTQGIMVSGSLFLVLGLLLGYAGALFPAWMQRRQTTRRSRVADARDLATRTVLALDDFVGGCYAAAYDNPEFNPSDSGEFMFHTDDPVLVLPKDADWTILDPDLAEDIRWLPNRVRNVLDGLESLDLASPDFSDYFQHRQEDFSRLGLRALALVDRLCDTYALKRPDRPSYYDPKTGFTSKVDEITAFWRRRQQTQAVVPKESSNITSLFGNTRPKSRDPLPDVDPN